MNKLNKNGAVAEELAALHFLREGYYVFKPILGFGPVDLIAVDAGGDIILADVKAESSRVNTGRSKKSRITRVRSKIQKMLNVVLCYVDLETGNVHVTNHAAN